MALNLSLLQLTAVAAASASIGAFYYFRCPSPTLKQRADAINFFRDPKGEYGIVAHRGGPYACPENTLSALKQCILDGAIAAEVDVDATKDGHLVLMHDTTVDRTTNGTGLTRSFTLEEIRKLTACKGHPKAAVFADERVPTLNEVIDLCEQSGLKLILDLRSNVEIARILAKSFKERPWLYDHALVTSFFPHVLFVLRKLDPKILTGLITREKPLEMRVEGAPRTKNMAIRLSMRLADAILHWSVHHWLWNWLGVAVISKFKNEMDEKYIKMWTDRGLQTVVWTVNDVEEKNRFSKYTPYMTDCTPRNMSCGEQNN